MAATDKTVLALLTTAAPSGPVHNIWVGCVRPLAVFSAMHVMECALPAVNAPVVVGLIRRLIGDGGAIKFNA